MRGAAFLAGVAIVVLGGGTLISLSSGGDGVPPAGPALAMTTTPSFTPTRTPTFKPTHTPKATTTPFPGKNTPPPAPTSCPDCTFQTPTDPGPTSTYVPTATPGHMWYIDPVALSRIAIPGPVTTTAGGDWCQGAVPYSFGVASTEGFPAGGWFYVRKENYGTTFFVYNSKTATTFNITSCFGSQLIYKSGTPVHGPSLYLLCLSRRDPFGPVDATSPLLVNSTLVCYHTYEPQAPPLEPDGVAGTLPEPSAGGEPLRWPAPHMHIGMSGGTRGASLVMESSIASSPACRAIRPNVMATLQVVQGLSKTAGNTYVGSAAMDFMDSPPSTPGNCLAGKIGTFIGPYIVTGLLADHDQDQDGCTDRQELGGDTFAGTGGQVGGLRDPWSFWDFFDVPAGMPPAKDGITSGIDFFALLGRFGSTGDPSIDPLSAVPDAPEYHPAFDRGAVMGPYLWNTRPADGSIAATDLFTMLAQFGHTCG